MIGISEWRSLGKPPSAEAYAQAVGRAEKGERREFRRFAATLDVKLGRVPTWRGQPGQTEQTTTEVVAKGGALVRSRMAIEKGETLMFEAGSGFKTRAEVVNISAPKQGATEPWLRLGLRFLDAPLPDSLIPRDAKPVD